jgi:tetratricopeptide (TPR) repeat protein
LNETQYDEAVQILKELTINPKDLTIPLDKIWHDLGICYSKLGRRKKAIRAYKHSLDYSLSFILWYDLGIAYAQVQD